MVIIKAYHAALVSEARSLHVTKAQKLVHNRTWWWWVPQPICIGLIILFPGMGPPWTWLVGGVIIASALGALIALIHAGYVVQTYARREFPDPDNYYR